MLLVGKTQSLESLHHVAPVWRPISAQREVSSHQIAAAGESVVRSEEHPSSKSDSTLWCHKAAACSDVLPFGHGKTTKANTEKADAARSCGVNRHRHVNNMGHGGAKSHDQTKS